MELLEHAERVRAEFTQLATMRTMQLSNSVEVATFVPDLAPLAGVEETGTPHEVALYDDSEDDELTKEADKELDAFLDQPLSGSVDGDYGGHRPEFNRKVLERLAFSVFPRGTDVPDPDAYDAMPAVAEPEDPFQRMAYREIDAIAGVLLGWRRCITHFFQSARRLRSGGLGITGFDCAIPDAPTLKMMREEGLEAADGTNPFSFPFTPNPVGADLDDIPAPNDDIGNITNTRIYLIFLQLVGAKTSLEMSYHNETGEAAPQKRAASELITLHTQSAGDFHALRDVERAVSVLCDALVESCRSLVAAIRCARRTRLMMVSYAEATGGRNPARPCELTKESIAQQWRLRSIATPQIQLRRLADLVGMCHVLNPQRAEAYLKRIQQSNEQQRKEMTDAIAEMTKSKLLASPAVRRGTIMGIGNVSKNEVITNLDAKLLSSAPGVATSPNPSPGGTPVSNTTPTEPNPPAIQFSIPHRASLDITSASSPGPPGAGHRRRSTSVNPSVSGNIRPEENDSIIPTNVLKDLESICNAYGLLIPVYEMPQTKQQRASITAMTRTSSLITPMRRRRSSVAKDDPYNPYPAHVFTGTAATGATASSRRSSVASLGGDMDTPTNGNKEKDINTRLRANFARLHRDVCLSTHEAKAEYKDTASQTNLVGAVGPRHIQENLERELTQERKTLATMQHQLHDYEAKLSKANKTLDYFTKLNRIEMIRKTTAAAFSDVSVASQQAHTAGPLGDTGNDDTLAILYSEVKTPNDSEGSPLRITSPVGHEPSGVVSDPDMEATTTTLASLNASKKPQTDGKAASPEPNNTSALSSDTKKRADTFLSNDELLFVEGQIIGELTKRGADRNRRLRRNVTKERESSPHARRTDISAEEMEAFNPLMAADGIDFGGPTPMVDAILMKREGDAREVNEMVRKHGTQVINASEGVVETRPEGHGLGLTPSKQSPRKTREGSPPRPVSSPAVKNKAEPARSSPPPQQQEPVSLSHVYHRSFGSVINPAFFGPKCDVTHCGSLGPLRPDPRSMARFANYSSGDSPGASASPGFGKKSDIRPPTGAGRKPKRK